MSEYNNVKYVISHLEYHLTKEIERNLSGFGDKCYKYLEESLNCCLRASREISYKPFYNNIKEYLYACGYDHNFIKDFLEKVEHDEENAEKCPGW